MIHVLESLTKLAEAGKKLSNIHGSAELYETIFDLVGDIFENDTAAILLKDPRDGTLSIAAARGYDPTVVKTFRAGPGSGITGRVASSGQPALITETINDPEYIQGVPEAVSEMAVPLRAGEEIIGVLDMESKVFRFTTADLSLFVTFGEQVATAIRNLQLQASLEERARRLVAVAKVGRSLTTIRSLDAILPRILELTEDALKLDTCSIQLWDETQDNLVVTAARGYDRDIVGLKVPRGVGVTGKVADTKRPSIIPDVSKTVDYIPGLSGCRSEMAIPLMFRDEVIGVFNIEHREADRFDDTDLLHATIFADQAAEAIGNARIRDDLERSEVDVARLKHRLDVLTETAAKVTGKGDLEALLDEILALALSNLEFDHIAVLLPEPSGFHLKVERANGYAEGAIGKLIPIEGSITGDAYRTGAPVFVRDVRQDPRYIAGVEDGRSEIAVALRVDDDVVGVLDAESDEVDKFTLGDVQVLEMLSSLVASAVRNARQRADLAERNRRLTLIHKAACSLNTVDHPEKMLENILDLAHKALDLDAVAILIPDKGRQHLVVRKALHHGDVEGLKVPIGKGFVGSMFVDGKAGIIEDIEEYEDYIPGTPGARSEMAAPLVLDGETIGVLDAEAMEPFAFTKAHLDLLRVFASQVATALKSSRIIAELENRARRLTLIHRAACSLNSIDDPEEMLGTILKLASQALDLKSMAIIIPDKDGKHLVVRKALQHGNVEGLKIPIGQGFVGNMFVTGEAGIIDDIAAFPGYIPGTPGARSEMAAPLSLDGETIGVLDAEAMEPNAFSEPDLALLRIFGSQVATALKNARMIADLNAEARKLTLIHRAACSLNSIDDPEEMLETVLRMAEQALGLASVAILIPDKDRRHLVVRKALNHGDVEGLKIPIGQGFVGNMFVTGEAGIIDDIAAFPGYITGTPGARSEMAAPLSLDGETVGVIDAEAMEPNAFFEADLKLLRVFGSQVATALNNARLILRLRSRGQRLSLLNKAARSLNSVHAIDELIADILKAAKEALDLDRCALLLVDPSRTELRVNAAIGYGDVGGISLPLGKGITGVTAVAGEPTLVRDTRTDDRYVNGRAGGRSEMAAPLRVHGEVIGVLDTESPLPDAFDEEDLELFAAFASQAAVAIHNARLFQGLDDANKKLSENVTEMARLNSELESYAKEIAVANKSLEWQLKKLTTVHEAGKAITASLDLDDTLKAILEMTSAIVGSTATAIKLLDDETRELRTRAESGALSEISGSWSVFDLPLKIGEKTIGVFELVRSAQEGLGREERQMLETMASQAAIAIENARLFEDTQRIYYETLKSLAKALEARDDYTRGHSERVADLSRRIALRMGLGEGEVHTIYNAALLHDIGKIGIRDEVLLAPRRLSEEEMQIIREHPAFGNMILMPLKFLGEIREYVRHHHERWDGTGYPDGRKEDDIPLASRIIAVADTYDAMTSSRPYRTALSPETAIGEIDRSQGKQFDPMVVKVFLEVIAA